MHVMFLATQPGEVRGRISVKTSAGATVALAPGPPARNVLSMPLLSEA